MIFFFYKMLEKINHYPLSNCIGYYDYDHDRDYYDSYKGKRYNFPNKISRYSFDQGLPEVIVVTAHKDGKLYKKLIFPMLKDKYKFTGKIISISNYNSNN